MMLSQLEDIMASMPAPPKPAAHHEYKSWSSSWYDHNGKRHWKRFGKCTEINRAVANARYQRWLETEWKPNSTIRDGTAGNGFSVKKLCVLYAEVARKRYLKNGKLTSHIDQVESALNAMMERYGSKAADDIGAPDIIKLRDAMIYSKDRQGAPTTLTATTVNGRLRIIKQAYKWGRNQGLIDRAAAVDVAMADPLEANRGDVKRSKIVLPVPQDIIDRTLEECTKTLADMICVQQLTGMRSGELCDMRPCDIVKVDKDCWIYTPRTHKTEHKGKTRKVYIGSRAHKILAPYIEKRAFAEPIFLPSEAHQERLVQIGFKKVMAYQMSRSVFKPGRAFTAGSYRNHIERTCDRVFDADGKNRAKRVYSHRWNPHRLRHNFATSVRESEGVEAASILLGHSSISTTLLYAEKSDLVARRVARKVG